MKGFKRYPWQDWQEFCQVYEQIFRHDQQLPTPAQLKAPLSTLYRWLTSNFAQPFNKKLDITYQTLSSIYDLQTLTHSSSSLHSLNHRLIRITELASKAFKGSSDRKMPMQAVAEAVGFPRIVVELRHIAIHENGLGWKELELSFMKVLEWLRDAYWQPAYMKFRAQSEKVARLARNLSTLDLPVQVPKIKAEPDSDEWNRTISKIGKAQLKLSKTVDVKDFKLIVDALIEGIQSNLKINTTNQGELKKEKKLVLLIFIKRLELKLGEQFSVQVLARLFTLIAEEAFKTNSDERLLFVLVVFLLTTSEDVGKLIKKSSLLQVQVSKLNFVKSFCEIADLALKKLPDFCAKFGCVKGADGGQTIGKKQEFKIESKVGFWVPGSIFNSQRKKQGNQDLTTINLSFIKEGETEINGVQIVDGHLFLS